MSDYDTDFYTWTQTQAAALRAQEWKTLDLEHLAEEIESLGRSDRDAIESQLVRVLLHLLKLAYDPAPRPRRGWRVTVADAREQIDRKARHGLQHHPAAYLPEAYRYARRKAALATERPLTDFPEACPWLIEQVLDEDFWPDRPASAPEDDEPPIGPRWARDAREGPPEGRGPGRT
jgi:Domain of unknown function DUF29